MRRWLFLLTIILATTTALANRPKVGLVLGGGGAKGGAEVGALKAIEEAGVKIDFIAGTSIGSIVGALHAAGYTSDELDTLFTQQSWLTLLTDRREDLFNEPFKQEKGITYIFGFPVFTKDEPSIGMLAGNTVEQTIDSMLLAKGANRFEDLKIPFRCVTAELKTASEVVISEGNIAQAVRASMAIPGVFRPKTIDGKSLIDGGMMNNLPVDVVRAMGADIIIAIDLQQNKHESRKADRNNMLLMLADMFGLGDLVGWIVNRPDITKYNENRHSADVYINPPLPDQKASNFGNKDMEQMIQVGYESTMKEIKALQEIAERQKAF